MTQPSMIFISDGDKTAFIVYIELILMKREDVPYSLVLTKLDAYYHCGIKECIDHLEYLKIVMKEVYEDNYDDVLDAIMLETDKIYNIDEFKFNFFKLMMN